MRITTLLLAFCALLASNLSAQRSSDQQVDKFTLGGDNDVFGQLKIFSPGITDPPESPVRAMAEWEELQSIAIAYNRSDWFPGHLQALRDIAREASTETEVIVICELERDQDDFVTEDIDISNITFIPVGLGNVDQIWIRDYGPHTLYSNDVDSMLLVDWIYEPFAENMDTIASFEVAEYYDLPLYLTTEAPLNLRLDGGNFLTDGMGTAFSSKRVLNENGDNEFFVDHVMDEFMGIDTYVKFDELEYDVIHHIDMHMKLLDEETILVGQYPEGVSDYEIIESNIAYLQENYQTPFGTDYKVERILMPPDQNGQYPEGETDNFCSASFFSACYNTYTNALFVNSKILVPTYELPLFDNEALHVWQELMPGYEVVGINCKDVIPYFGAVHCISKEIGHNDPLWIVHQKVSEACITDNQYRFEARVKHRTGIEDVKLYYKNNLEAPYQEMEMEWLGESVWELELDPLPEGTDFYYYIEATANSGKQIRRPIAAPDGYWHFQVEDCSVSTDVEDIIFDALELKSPFPNPGRGDIFIPLKSNQSQMIVLKLKDVLGRNMTTIFEGKSQIGEHQYKLQSNHLATGTYFIELQSEGNIQTRKLIIK